MSITASIIAGIIFPVSVFAAGNTVDTSHFSINLPADMDMSYKSEDKENGLYRYLFLSSSETASPMLEIDATIPPRVAENKAQIVSLLGFMIGMYVDTHRLYPYLNDPAVQEVLKSSEAKTKVLGDHKYHYFNITFGNQETMFLVITVNNKTYAFRLVSMSKDRDKAIKGMEKLQGVIKKLKYH